MPRKTDAQIREIIQLLDRMFERWFAKGVEFHPAAQGAHGALHWALGDDHEHEAAFQEILNKLKRNQAQRN